MPRRDDSIERLRAAIEELAAADAADLLAEARIEARARVRGTLTDALAHSMLEHLHEQLNPPERVEPPIPAPPAPVPDATPAPRRRRRRSSAEPAWYVYGVVAGDAELNEQLSGVDPSQPVTLSREGALAAVTSQVPLEEFDEARLREHLADMSWVETTARAHEAVLDRVRDRATVVPMRMCTVYRTEGGVREMLSRESEPLADALDHLDGKAEWAVKVFTKVARIGGRSPDVEAGAGDSPGADYMQRMRSERELRERAMDLTEAAAAELHDRLTAVASDARLIPLQRREVSGHPDEMILNGVYLVADADVPAFHEEVKALRSELETHGIELEPTGPWPAYNFVPGAIGAAW